MKILTVILTILSLNAFAQVKEESNSIIGSWYFIFDDEYFEVHFTEDIIIRNDEYLGIQLIYILGADLIGKEVRTPSGELMIVHEVSKTRAKMSFGEQGEYELVRIEGLVVEAQKIRNGNDSYVNEFLKSFNERKVAWEKSDK